MSFLSKEEDWRFYSSTFCLDDLSEFDQCEKLLDALESVAAPEYWGDRDGAIVGPYDRKAIAEFFKAQQTGEGGTRFRMSLKRSSAPRYMAVVNVGTTVHPHSVRLEGTMRHSEGEVEQLFQVVDTIAESMHVDFASIDINREGQDPSTRMLRSGTSENLDWYIDVGPGMIWVRTYFGPRVIALAAEHDVWTSCGGIWRPSKNGVMVLDLHEQPWAAAPKDLKAVHQEVFPKLVERTGVFYFIDDDDDNADYPPRPPRWQPPPGAKWPDA